MKNKTFWDSVRCAWRGFIYAIKSEKNFAIYFVIAAVFFAVNILCGVSFTEHIVYFALCAGVFSSEMLNTAIEHLSDIVTEEYSDKIRLVKDIAAAGVIVWGFVYFAAEAAVIIRCVVL